MKRWQLAILLCVLALSALVGCGTDIGASSVPQDVSQESSQPENQPQEEPEVEYAPGTWVTDSRFESEFWNIAFTLPQNWLAATAEELGVVTEKGGALLNEELRAQAEKAFETGASFTEMGATNLGEGINLIMMVDNFSGIMGGSTITEETYANIVAQQLKNLTEMAYTMEQDLVTLTIADKEFTVMKALVQEYGIAQWYALYKKESYMCTLVCTFPAQSKEEDILTVFSDVTVLSKNHK